MNSINIKILWNKDGFKVYYYYLSKEPFYYDNIPELIYDLGYVLELEVSKNVKKKDA